MLGFSFQQLQANIRNFGRAVVGRISPSTAMLTATPAGSAAPTARSAAPAEEGSPDDGLADIATLQTLAVHLNKAAAARAARHQALAAELAEELATNSSIEAETSGLRAEIRRVQDLLSGELDGGDEWRAMRTLLEERARREALDEQVAQLRGKLTQISESVKGLSKQRQEPAADEVIENTTEDALTQLKGLAI